MGLNEVASGGWEIAKRLIPPVDGDKWARFRYDLTISICVFIGGAALIFHIAWICGWLAFMGLTPPFAYAEEVRNGQHILMDVQRSELDVRIQNAKKQVCLSIAAKNQSALDAWARNLESLKQQYRDQLGHEPNVMGCEELIIGASVQQ